ncbi:MAG: hypothetical protein WA941_08620, partial [Nitrososphaeraceae archaeon]
NFTDFSLVQDYLRRPEKGPYCSNPLRRSSTKLGPHPLANPPGKNLLLLNQSYGSISQKLNSFLSPNKS